ncbi:MAG: hypothetical protein HZA52_19985 [Planctomycetes bacterium]|nr:hypothetical protein [Planctomycetota bacterium]
MNKSSSLAAVGWALLGLALWVGVDRAASAPALHDARVMTATLVAVASYFAVAFRTEWNLLRRHSACLAPLGWYFGTVLTIAVAVGAPFAGFALLGGGTAALTGAAIGAVLGLVLLIVVTVLFEGWCAAYVAAIAEQRKPDLWDTLVLAARKLPSLGIVEFAARAPGVFAWVLVYFVAFRNSFSAASVPNAALVAACVALPLALVWNVVTAAALTASLGADRGPRGLARAFFGGLRIARKSWWRVGAHMLLVGAFAYVSLERPAEPGQSAKQVQVLTPEGGIASTEVRMETDVAGAITREQRFVVSTAWTGGFPFTSRWLAGDGIGKSTGPQNFPSAVACLAVFFSSLALRLFVARALAQPS